MSIEATLFILPNGQQRSITITKVTPEDEAWFKANAAKLSLEELRTGEVVMYADIGMRTREGDEVEAIEVAGSRTCSETLAALRKQCEEMLASWPDKVVTMKEDN